MMSGNSVSDPGVWGNNLRVDVDHDTSDPRQLFNLTISEVAPPSGQVLRTETYRNLTMTSGTPHYVVDLVNQGSKLVQVSNAATSGQPAATGTLSLPLPVPAEIPNITAQNRVFNVIVDPGSGPQSPLRCVFTYGDSPPPIDYPGLRPFL